MIESLYTRIMYYKDIARWEAFHEGDVYDDEEAQRTHDRVVLKKVNKSKVRL